MSNHFSKFAFISVEMCCCLCGTNNIAHPFRDLIKTLFLFHFTEGKASH